MFRINVVWKRLRKRLSGNIITASVILIGALLLMFSLNVLLDIRRQNRELLDNAADTAYTISSRNVPNEPRTRFISKEQLRLLQNVSSLQVDISIVYDIVTFAGKSHLENGEEITDKYNVTFSENASAISMEKDFAEILPYLNEKNTVNVGDIDLSGIEIYNTFDDGKEHIHSCVMPLDKYWEIAQPSGFSEFVLTAVCETADSYEKIPVLREILSSSDEYEFYIGNKFYEFISKASYVEQALSKIVFFSVMMLTVVFVSTVCVFLCLVDERAFEIAVCRTVGASATEVFFEFLSELLFVSLIPAFVSIFVNILFFNNAIDFSGVSVSRLNIIAVVLSVAGILFADGICVIPVAFKLRRLKPYELLAAEG